MTPLSLLGSPPPDNGPPKLLPIKLRPLHSLTHYSKEGSPVTPSTTTHETPPTTTHQRTNAETNRFPIKQNRFPCSLIANASRGGVEVIAVVIMAVVFSVAVVFIAVISVVVFTVAAYMFSASEAAVIFVVVVALVTPSGLVTIIVISIVNMMVIIATFT